MPCQLWRNCGKRVGQGLVTGGDEAVLGPLMGCGSTAEHLAACCCAAPFTLSPQPLPPPALPSSDLLWHIMSCHVLFRSWSCCKQRWRAARA